jgi:hypothetical protein
MRHSAIEVPITCKVIYQISTEFTAKYGLKKKVVSLNEEQTVK